MEKEAVPGNNAAWAMMYLAYKHCPALGRQLSRNGRDLPRFNRQSSIMGIEAVAHLG